MRAFVFAHIDELCRFFNCAKRPFYRGVRAPNEGHDRPVRRRARIDIEQRNAVCRFNRVGNLPNNFLVAPFRKIWHTLDQLLHTIAVD